MGGVVAVMWVLTLLLSVEFGTADREILVGPAVVEASARRFAEEQEVELAKQCRRTMLAAWTYQTNLTTLHRSRLVSEQESFKRLQEETRQQASRWRAVEHLFTDPQVKQKISVMSTLGLSELPSPSMTSYQRVLGDMTHIYSSSTVCTLRRPSRCGLSPHAGINEVLSTSRDPEELGHLWRSWRDSTRTIRDSYAAFVTLANQAARTNNFDNKGDLSLVEYGGSAFREQLTEAWTQLEPLYRQLHAYVRRKLREVYGAHHVRERGPLPAHLLGDLWGQAWPLSYLLPYPDLPPVDVTYEMKRQGYTPRRIFEVADSFFASLGLSRAPASFWRSSLLEDPKDTPIVCSASSWDFCDGRDFRVKQCTKVSQDDLISAHHEMAHLQYFQQYSHLPYLYRKGANPGFQEAVGLAVGLSVATPKYFRRLGLLGAGRGTSLASQLNTLMSLALRQLPFMPYARVLDLWRDGVLNGSIPREDWNCAWWDLRVSVQGVKPPEVRTERDFDPAAKYQVAADLSYTRYFVAFVLQFQMYQALCKAAGEYKEGDLARPLHQCDFYQSTKAGDMLRSMMQLGASVPWEEAIGVLTQGRETKLSAAAMREYYRPLEEWLTRQNKRHSEFVGWRPDGEYCLYKKPFRPTSCNLT